LINVSGFHVDPGWCGKLIFSVYNAGPASVHLSRGEELFLILYSDLSHGPSNADDSKKTYHGTRGRQDSIPSELISNMAGQVFSPMYLERELRELRRTVTRLDLVSGALLAIAVAFASNYFLKEFRQTDSAGRIVAPTIVNNISTSPQSAKQGENKPTLKKTGKPSQ
jgi:hypothetical protein